MVWLSRASWAPPPPTARSRPTVRTRRPRSPAPTLGGRSRPTHRGGAMPEAVIVDAIRTPIGRAMKGTLRSVRADNLAAIPLRALVERNPAVDFSETDDIMMGCGFPEGEQSYN